MDDDPARKLVFTESFKDDLAQYDFTLQEWHVIRDKLVELAFARSPICDPLVCKVNCCREVGEKDLLRLKLRKINARVFFTYDTRTLTAWFALRRTDLTYTLVEAAWKRIC